MLRALLLLALAAPVHAASLQFDIVDKAGWRAGKAEQVPAAVTESYSYEPASDTVVVSEKFDRKGFAPLPPMLALAMKYGFPVQLDQKPVEVGADCCLGPLVGFEGRDGYTYRVKGLGRYVLDQRAPGAGKVPAGIQREIEAQVEKILAAGHLAPWLVLVNVPGSGANDRGDVYWQNPGETLYYLAEAAPYLPAATLAKLKAYLKEERDTFPPEELLSLPLALGTHREATPYDPALLKKWETKNLAYRCKGEPSLWGLYGLARYYQLLGEKPGKETMAACSRLVARRLENRDWATLYWLRGHTPEFNAVHAANQLFAGAVGYIRLARLAGDQDAEALGWGLLARTAALRFAMGKYTQYLADSRQLNVNYGPLAGRHFGQAAPPAPIRVETDPKLYTLPKDPAWQVKRHAGDWIGELVTWSWTKPLDDVRQVHRLDETGVDVWEWAGVDCYGTGQKRDADPNKDYWYNRLAPHLLPFQDMVPELGRFMADRLRPESEAYCRRVAENLPHWYLAYSEAILGAEIGFNLPADAYGQFLARAWILKEKPETLERYVDVPWVQTGDLFTLDKLVETAAAYRGTEWHPAR